MSGLSCVSRAHKDSSPFSLSLSLFRSLFVSFSLKTITTLIVAARSLIAFSSSVETRIYDGHDGYRDENSEQSSGVPEYTR